jgi:protocatechuate 3,4-dioxygenase beta subunit
MRILAAVLSLLPLLGCQAPPAKPPAAPTPAPRDAEAVSDAHAAAIAALRTRFARERDLTVAAVLTDPRYRDLHDKTPFRELLATHAAAAPLPLVDKDERGTPLAVHGRVIDDHDKPVANAIVYAYHTDARGFYGYDRAHVSGNAGDEKHARLFGYVRTDERGAFELRTNRPASYPDSELPQHIHVEISGAGFATLVTEVLFDDDRKLTAAQRQHAKNSGFQVVAVDVGKDRVGRCGPVFTLPAR